MKAAIEPQINADERGFGSPTERVLSAIFEVANTLGAEFPEESMQNAAVARRLRGRRYPAEARSFGLAAATDRRGCVRSDKCRDADDFSHALFGILFAVRYD